MSSHGMGNAKDQVLVEKEDREWNGSSIPHLPADRLARTLAFPGSRGQNKCSSYPIVSGKKKRKSVTQACTQTHTHKHAQSNAVTVIYSKTS